MSDTGAGFIFGLWLGGILATSIMAYMFHSSMRQIRQDAIEHGVAEYVIVDVARGKTEFVWKQIK